ncbi:MAG: hypothetical protein NC078_02395 [Ruminococcus sp.]|nr:hypothetical protein [Ruminococcus sp.]
MKIQKKILSFLLPVLTVGAALLLIIAGRESAQGAAAAAMNCFNTLIPSLYAFTVISKLIISTNTYKLLGRPFDWAARKIFRMPGDCFAVMLISQAAGYPIGAALTAQMYRRGKISAETAEQMLCFCIAPGPAFIMAVCRNAVPGCPGAWKAVFAAVAAANILMALLTAPFRKKPDDRREKISLEFSGQTFGAAVRSGAEAMSMICGCVIFAGAVMGALDKFGLLKAIAAALGNSSETYPFVKAFLEVSCLAGVTSGVSALPFISAFLSFGGLCVHLQIASVCEGFSPVKALAARIPAAFISFAVCGGFMPRLYKMTAVAVSGNVADRDIIIGQNSPILSIILLIMTILIISQKSYSQNSKNVV